MGPALRVDLALGGLLDPVVADRGGRVQRLVNVRPGELVDQRPARVRIRGGGRVVGPDAGKAVGLQLEPDRRTLRALAVAAHAVHGAEQVLDMVAVLVRDHIPPAHILNLRRVELGVSVEAHQESRPPSGRGFCLLMARSSTRGRGSSPAKSGGTAPYTDRVMLAV